MILAECAECLGIGEEDELDASVMRFKSVEGDVANVCVPNFVNKNDHALFVQQLEDDISLKPCKVSADKQEKGFFWENGLLFHRTIGADRVMMKCLVLPVQRRKDWLTPG